MASRCVLVIRGMSNPFVVDLISSREEASGVRVPMPAEPVEGKVLVCVKAILQKKRRQQVIVSGLFICSDLILKSTFTLHFQKVIMSEWRFTWMRHAVE